MLSELCTSIGWQGGTIHQVKAEIIRLKNIETATKLLMNDLSFAYQAKQFKPKDYLLKSLNTVNNAFKS